MRDPLTNARYKVELEGLGELGFIEISGLKDTTEVEEYWEGGSNEYVHKLVGNTKVDNLVFKHGLGPGTRALWKLREAVILGEPQDTFDGAVVLTDDEGEEVHRWPFENGFIVRWEGPVLKGQGSSIAVETMEIACTPKRKTLP